ncbi:Dehydrogenase/reductase SDR family member 7 [Geodia barretti]|nr:Dehydrogenase/reductase SDR family member 7 [Geodia barretti]
MTAQRCAQLTLVAISNQLLEVWVSRKPALYVPYLAHYAPSTLHFLWRARSGAFIHETMGRSSY